MRASVPVRRAVARMRPYNPPLGGRLDKVRLDFNENPFGCSPAVLRALRKLGTASVSIYPEQETVRRKIAKYFGVRPEKLLLTNGTDEALNLVVNTFVEPTFAMYRFYSEIAGTRIRALRYDAALQFPMKEVLAALRSSPRAFFLANPNSPTGNALSLRELSRIVKAARNTLFVVDEAYFEFCGVTVLPWIRRFRNLVVTRTFSKAAGLAGLRLGCLFAHQDVAAALRKAESPYPVNVAALVAAEAAIRDRAFLRKTVSEVRSSRKNLERGLARLRIQHFPSAGNFILVNLGDRVKEIVFALARREILIRDRSSDFGGAGYARITVGTVSQTRQLLRQLEEIL